MIDIGQPQSDLPIPPGEYLVEVLKDLSMTQVDLARRMGRPPQAINEIIKAEKAITPETALQLEQVVGVPAHIWTGLEADYQLVCARQRESVSLQSEVSFLTDVPYRELAKLKLVKEARNPIQKVRELRRFFGVASLRNAEVCDAIFRVARNKQASKLASATWLRAGRLQAKKIKVERLDKARLKASIPLFRKLTRENIGTAQSKLGDLLSASGIAFVIQPHFPKTYVHAATFWLSQENAAMVVTIRGAWADIFWFSIFHEIGHIFLHGKNSTFVEGLGRPQTKAELEADEYARDTLIPPDAYRDFRASLDLSPSAISRFSEQIDVSPGIVVGRLQHDEIIGHRHHNELRGRLTWS